MDASGELVFVYGTLRSGGTHHWRMNGAEFIRAGKIRGRMYRFDWYPGLVADEGAGEITGEVYAVAAAHLAELDLFEGLSAGEIEGSEYRRIRVAVEGDGDPVIAWIWEWLGPVDEAKRITGGDWLNAPEI
jgi:gamma-glutamylcyclotransferase (GGCT)/AIG2-like uncharacterized protein YtfP